MSTTSLKDKITANLQHPGRMLFVVGFIAGLITIIPIPPYYSSWIGFGTGLVSGFLGWLFSIPYRSHIFRKISPTIAVIGCVLLIANQASEIWTYRSQYWESFLDMNLYLLLPNIIAVLIILIACIFGIYKMWKPAKIDRHLVATALLAFTLIQFASLYIILFVGFLGGYRG